MSFQFPTMLQTTLDNTTWPISDIINNIWTEVPVSLEIINDSITNEEEELSVDLHTW